MKRIRTEKANELHQEDILEIIICPAIEYINIPIDVKELLGPCRAVLVSRYPPSTRAEFLTWGKYWPINYKPRQAEHTFLPTTEFGTFDEYMHHVLTQDEELQRLTGRERMGAIIVNPLNKKVTYLINDNILSLILYMIYI